MEQEVKTSNVFRVGKPIVEMIQYTKGTLFAQTVFQYQTSLLKILEWSFFYFLCYMGYGYGWLLFLGSIYHMKLHKEEGRRITSNDIKNSNISLTSLPSWVIFPDFDRVNWINTILEKMWTHMNCIATSFIKATIERKIQNSLEKLQIKQLADFEINHVDLGTTPVCVDGIKTYDTKYNKEIQSEDIIMDCDLVYEGNGKINFSIQGFLAEISSIKFRGRIRLQLKPLINRIPFIGGIEMFFLERPFLEYDLGGVGNLADLPGVSSVVRNLVDDIISSKLVWPNRLKVTLSKECKTMPLIPSGAFTVTIIEAKNLIKADFRGLSDPYAIISMGERKISFKDKYVAQNLNPKWNYISTFAVEHPEGHTIKIEVYDFDKGRTDDFLGQALLSIGATGDATFDKWIKLEGVESGEVRVVCQWKVARAISDFSHLKSNFVVLKDLYLVSVFVHECENLVGGNGDTSLLYPNCQIELRNMSSTKEDYTTPSKNKTENPRFERGYIFPCDDPQNDELRFTILNTMKKNNISFGNITIPINLLMASPNQELLHREWHLEEGNPSAKILISLKLYCVE